MFFNRLSFRDRWNFTSVSKKEAEERSELMLETLRGLPTGSLRFRPVPERDTWIARWPKDCSTLKGKAFVAQAGNHVIEVIDTLPELNSNLNKDHGLIPSVERLVSVYDKTKGPRHKGSMFMRVSRPFAPLVNVFTRGTDDSNASFIDKGDNAKSLKRKVRQLLHTIEQQIPDPDWTKEHQGKLDNVMADAVTSASFSNLKSTVR